MHTEARGFDPTEGLKQDKSGRLLDEKGHPIGREPLNPAQFFGEKEAEKKRSTSNEKTAHEAAEEEAGRYARGEYTFKEVVAEEEARAHLASEEAEATEARKTAHGKKLAITEEDIDRSLSGLNEVA